MVKHIIALSIFTMIVLASCSNETKEIDTNSATNEVETVIRHADTTIDISPIQIGNDKGQIEVTGIRMYENNLLTHSHFYISLKDISSYHMNRLNTPFISLPSFTFSRIASKYNALDLTKSNSIFLRIADGR
jgi:uncharacterized protein YrrD